MKDKRTIFVGLLFYYVLTVMPHEQVGAFINSIFQNFSRPTYNLIIGSFVTICGLSGLVYFYPKIIRHPEKKKIVLYIISNILLITLCFKILFVVNIEAIHFFQYAFFAILCFYLTSSYFRSIIIGSLAGFFDELYQYVILTPDSMYFDFNDVVIDIVGVGIGLTIIKIINSQKSTKSISSYLKLPEIWVLISLFCTYIIGTAMGFISVLQNEDSPSSFTLLKYLPENFWTIFKVPYAKFHILLPMEGLVLIILLWIFYFPLEWNGGSSGRLPRGKK